MSIHWLHAKVDSNNSVERMSTMNFKSYENSYSLSNAPNHNSKDYRDLFPPNSKYHFDYYRFINLPQVNNEISINPAIDRKDRLQLQLNTEFKNVSENLVSIMVYFNDKALTDAKFLSSKCPVKNCRFKKIPEDYESADAVLFKEVPVGLTRPERKPRQTWIYYQLESPIHMQPIPEGITMNWTATYRRDSVLQTPYGRIGRKTTGNLLLSSAETKDYTKTKTKLIAWFVSNCRSDNGRMSYVTELQKHAEVHIFGDCGTRRCERNDLKCDEMLRRDYKFYLAFENSNCREYITEKLFNAYK